MAPGSLSFSLAAGGSAAQPISLGDKSTVPWTATTSAVWITVIPVSGTTPGTASVGVSAAGMQPGSYVGSVTISNPSANPSSETITVNLTVTGAAPAISINPSAVTFSAQTGSIAQPRTIQIGGTAGVAWQARAEQTSGSTWLVVSPTSGVTPASLTVTADATALAAGSWEGSVVILTPGASPSSSEVRVTLTVGAAGPPGGEIVTIAGGGAATFGGDGGPATAATLAATGGVAVDSMGNLFIATGGSIRKVSPSGTITTVAGGGNPTDGLGDNLPATLASLDGAYNIAVDRAGNLFIADEFHSRVRRVSATGIITTVAGNGNNAPSPAGGGGGFPAMAGRPPQRRSV